MTPPTGQPRNPLHGVTLEAMVTALAAHYGWPGLAERMPVRCFSSEPSVASSLKFLRKTPWARTKVERMYLDYHADFKIDDTDLFHSTRADQPWAFAGTSNLEIDRLLQALAATLDRGEVTDKGSINQRAVLAHRADTVAKLHADELRFILKPSQGLTG